jgi:hypothetical protein
MIYPRRVESMHQIEITSICNLRCSYCTWPKMPRPKQHMDRETYENALSWAKHFQRRGTQGELNLAGIGESTLHPDFVGYVARAREVLGPDIRLVIATNGLTMTEQMAEALKPHNLRIWVSLHRPEKAGPAIEILKRVGLLNGYSSDPSLASIDWAGQVDYHVSAAPAACDWLKQGWVMATADGKVTTCCLDATGEGVVGTLDDNPNDIELKPWKLCEGCHLVPPIAEKVRKEEVARP